MSWAEIKKAVNSKMDMPLDEMFGFELVRTGSADSMSYSGTKGILIVGARQLMQSSTTPIDIYVDGALVGIIGPSSTGNLARFGVFPFVNSVSTVRENTNYQSYTNYVLLALGGGIS